MTFTFEIADETDERARFALVIMSALNAMALVLIMKGTEIITAVDAWGLSLRVLLGCYFAGTIFHIWQAIEALRPRGQRGRSSVSPQRVSARRPGGRWGHRESEPSRAARDPRAVARGSKREARVGSRSGGPSARPRTRSRRKRSGGSGSNRRSPRILAVSK